MRGLAVACVVLGACGDDAGAVAEPPDAAVPVAGEAVDGAGPVAEQLPDAGDAGSLDSYGADVAPVTEGDWYRPDTQTTWQWQLTGAINAAYAVDVYDIDLFDVSAERIAELQSDGRKVICYFSAGSAEDWRPDFERFEAEEVGLRLDEWPGENWLDIRSDNVHAIMLARLDLAVDKGCDGVEPDNVDGFTNPTGYDLGARDQLAYNRFLANAAHRRGLAVGLKNDGDQAVQLVAYFDFELNEECHAYDECGQLLPFTEAGKPIWNAEYRDDAAQAEDARSSICPDALQSDLRTLILPPDLDDSFRVSCDS